MFLKEEMTEFVPGTVMARSASDNATGMEFLHRVYFVSDGIKLSQLREISGVDGTTLQNWVKRGWLLNPVNKLYGIDQLARILIINMMTDTVQLSRISFLLSYINGRIDTADDDIVQESVLYDYICRVLDIIDPDAPDARLRHVIAEVTSDYEERFPGAGDRLTTALEIIVRAYQATILKRHTDKLFEKIEADGMPQVL